MILLKGSTLILQSERPYATKMTALGIYLITSLVFVIGALAEFSVVVLLNRASLTTSKISENATTPKKEHVVLAKLRRRRQGIGRKLRRKIEARENCMLGIFPVRTVDYTAFWSFLFAFLLFNCIYWIHYSRA